jgi:prepilin-type N-terminal cleavage/methylation domain-containing protein
LDKKNSFHAFTLVEMAIVLVIVGLLIGGVVVGQSMIQAASVNSVVTDLNKYKTAFSQFYGQYSAMPGDYADAANAFGGVNGDGNNNISIGESYRSWQHLNLAGFVEGRFSGVAGGSNQAIPGTNIPEGRIANSGFTLLTIGAVSISDGNFFAMPAGVGLYFGRATGSDWAYNPILTPKDMLNLDLKIDDGKPATGQLRSLKPGINNLCTTGSNSAATYLITDTEPRCTVQMILE